MRFCKLRIGWSVFWGLACLVVLLLWLRSCWTVDGFGRGEESVSESKNMIIFVGDGDFTLERHIYPPRPQTTDHYPAIFPPSWLHWSYEQKSIGVGNFYWKHDPDETKFGFPILLLLLPFSISVAGPWICSPKRFSLRTLLLSITLMAMVLGLVVYVMK